VFQAWFVDSGKEGIAGSPVYLLAGYSARIPTWTDFADEWQDELNQPPRLKYLHAREAYGWKGVDFDPYAHSGWNATHGPKNRKARDERLVRFARLIVKYLTNASRSILLRSSIADFILSRLLIADRA
jgi:hypothetical protein